MNESLQKPWLLVIEAPKDGSPWTGYSYTVCGFDTRDQALRMNTVLRRIRVLAGAGRMEGDHECWMPDGNIVLSGDIGDMHLFRRDEVPA